MAVARSEYFSSLPYKVLQKRWLVIMPVVISMSLAFAYTHRIELYRSSGLVLFSTEYVLADGDQQVTQMFDDKVNAIVNSLLFGDSIRSIAQRVWNDIDEKADPVTFNNRVQSLASKGGIELSRRGDNDRALIISFTSQDPDEAHKVVESTIATLMEEARLHSERRTASSASFLTQEIEDKRRELEKIDQEIARIETGFGTMGSPSASGGDGVTANPSMMNDTQFRDQAQYYKSLPQVKFDLSVAEKELQRLSDRLSRKDFAINLGDLEATLSLGDDAVLKDLRTTLVQKERDRNVLSSQGILERHPKRKALEAEIKNLKALEEERIRSLAAQKGSSGSELLASQVESKLRQQISDKTEEVSRLRDRISVLERYYEEVRQQQDTIVSQIDVIAAQRSKLEQLKKQKEVLADAYRNSVEELEIIQRRSRADEGDIGLRITVAEEPKVPTESIPYAHTSTLLMTLALSFAAGVGLICAIDGLDHSVQSLGELRSVVTIPVIGEVESMISNEVRRRRRITRYVMVGVMALVVLFSGTIVEKLLI